MAPKRYFHFTLGPVQSFVAQARRTRDFWAGSFLLSWLAGVAMVAVRKQGGEINFPCPPGAYLDWIEGKTDAAGEPPRQGAIPNRFKSMCAEVPGSFDPAQVVASVHAAWQALAEHVWQGDGLDELAASGTRAIWERQHAGFWEVSWALTDDIEETALLDQRKNWRSHGFGQHEPGVKCMVMDGWQELSSQPRPGRAVAAFWQRLRNSPGRSGLATDLGEDEQLCALAYVKRRFTRHFHSFAVTLPQSGVTLRGWLLAPGMPSVAYMAAVHWLEALLQIGEPTELGTLLQCARDVCDDKSEWDTNIECLRQAVPDWHAGNAARQLLALDGQLFFRHVQDQPKAYDYDPIRMKSWRQELSAFQQRHPTLPTAPSPFYAILLMDGDSLGSHMSDRSKQQPISRALEKFTAVDGVPRIVREHNGCLIYAGGDDVLALLPLEDALRCAASVRAHYLECFKGTNIPTTISAAVQFAHVKTPLGLVLGDAHPLLDEVAKDGAGRDALAVRVWKTGGRVLQWAQPWKVALEDGRPDGAVIVEQLARLFAGDQTEAAPAGQAARYSNKFFFKIEERLAVLDPGQARGRTASSGDADRQLLLDLLAVDFWHSATNRKHLDIAQARQEIEPLLKQSYPRVRALTERGAEVALEQWKTGPLSPDAALLVRFLATKGIDGDTE